ncbi:PREDICTED: sodium/potassium-transporting ATPase subunit beta-1-like [Acromyrmex echinatior]|uniref:sodium/potassium-transporting ATPase subunit beta-1-like n=1 Tax=Acromyrmex echinatior TaxID=103372 RepID=UPI000581090D|nr:PREDICTED: sodium/potassium-transporting ATPase subunit beta-1-like [Acromyrmex echinatior]
MVILHDDEYYQNRIPEPDLGAFHNFLRFVWSPDRKQLLGRTGKEWALLGFFYLCFFTVLGSLFALQMWISINYASKLEKPFFLYSGLMPKSYFDSNFPFFRQLHFDNPGKIFLKINKTHNMLFILVDSNRIAFKPNILLPTKSPIIWIDNVNKNARPKRYVQALSDFLQAIKIRKKMVTNVFILEYNKSKENYKTVTECSDGALITSNTKPCFFDIESLGVCGQPPYGYTDPLQPCVLIKFNKRFNWVPIPYNKSSLLPENMPPALQEAVQFSNKFQIWLWCDGVNNVDKEHIGEIEYLPSPGFSVQYFPFIGHPDYLTPIVALRFKNVTLFRLVTVECSLWALNINKDAQNALDFQLILGEL